MAGTRQDKGRRDRLVASCRVADTASWARTAPGGKLAASQPRHGACSQKAPPASLQLCRGVSLGEPRGSGEPGRGVRLLQRRRLVPRVQCNALPRVPPRPSPCRHGTALLRNTPSDPRPSVLGPRLTSMRFRSLGSACACWGAEEEGVGPQRGDK